MTAHDPIMKPLGENPTPTQAFVTVVAIAIRTLAPVTVLQSTHDRARQTEQNTHTHGHTPIERDRRSQNNVELEAGQHGWDQGCWHRRWSSGRTSARISGRISGWTSGRSTSRRSSDGKVGCDSPALLRVVANRHARSNGPVPRHTHTHAHTSTRLQLRWPATHKINFVEPSVMV